MVRLRLAVQFAFALLLTIPLRANAQANSSESIEVNLPSVASDMAIGGDGDYLLIQMKELRKIAVFDTKARKIKGYIPASGDNVGFGAGLKKAIVVDPTSGVVSRWNLKTLKKELTKSIEADGLRNVLMGSAAENFAVIAARKITVLDVGTLTTSNMNIGGRGSRSLSETARVSANGTTMTSWGGGSPSGLQTYYKVGDNWEARYDHTSVGALLPTADGRHILTSRGVYTKELKVVSQNKDRSLLIPAQTGPFYINVAGQSLHLVGDARSMASLPSSIQTALKSAPTFARRRNNDEMPFDKRIAFLTKQKLIVVMASTSDSLTCFPYDVDVELSKSDQDYLIVGSGNPAKIKSGEMLSFSLNVKTNDKNVKYVVESGPKGLTVSSAGIVRWRTSKNVPPKSNVIVSITSGSGQQIFHAFPVEVEGATGSADSLASSSGSNSNQKTPNVQENKLGAAPVIVKFPSPVARVVPGGGGRYLCAHMPEIRKIAIFDVSTGKIAGYVPAADDKSYFAAGKEKLIVFSVTQSVVSRFNLADQKRELTKTIPFAGQVDSVGMGCDSNGPLMVRYSLGPGQIDSSRFGLLNIDTLKEVKLTWQRHPHAVVRDFNRIFASADGSVFTIFGVGAVWLRGENADLKSNFDRRSMIPSADGKFFVSNGTILNSQMQTLGDKNQRNQIIVPSVQGNYYFTFSSTSARRFPSPTEKSKYTAKLHMFGDSRPLISLKDISYEFGGNAFYAGNRTLHTDKIFFVPEAKVTAIVSSTNDSLTLYRLDIDEALESSGVDYLLVASQPKPDWKLGERFDYQLNVKSKNKGLKFNLDSAPDGMKIDANGKVTWSIPSSLDLDQHKVIVSVKDSKDQEVFHTFSVNIPEIKEKLRLEKERLAREKEAAMQRERLAAAKERLDALRTSFEARIAKAKADSESMPEGGDGGSEREWTDATGKYKIKAKFSKVVSRSKVELLKSDGSKVEIPLNKLDSKDAYLAVEMEIKRAAQGDPSSPFKKTNSTNLVPAKLQYEIYLDIQKMTKFVEGKSQIDPKDYSKFYDPAMTSRVRITNIVGFLESLYRIDLSRASIRGTDSVYSSRGRLKKINGSWKLN